MFLVVIGQDDDERVYAGPFHSQEAGEEWVKKHPTVDEAGWSVEQLRSPNDELFLEPKS